MQVYGPRQRQSFQEFFAFRCFFVNGGSLERHFSRMPISQNGLFIVLDWTSTGQAIFSAIVHYTHAYEP